jgi:hypothetical protein
MNGLLVPEAPTIIRRASIPQALRDWNPRSMLGQAVREALPYLPSDLAEELVERASSAGVIESQLALRHFGVDGRLIEDYGVVCRKVVTTAGVNAIVDAFQNSVELETFRYHGLGTSSSAEAVGDTALGTELTTQLDPNSTRATGTQTENGANVYQTVATNDVDATVAIVEHGIFTQAATGGGTLLDRSVFSVINLSSGESLESTYDITFTAGS